MVDEEAITVQTVGREQSTITGKLREWQLRRAQGEHTAVLTLREMSSTRPMDAARARQDNTAYVDGITGHNLSMHRSRCLVERKQPTCRAEANREHNKHKT